MPENPADGGVGADATRGAAIVFPSPGSVPMSVNAELVAALNAGLHPVVTERHNACMAAVSVAVKDAFNVADLGDLRVTLFR